MRKAVVFLAAAVLTALTPVRAPAWNNAGHKIIGLLAYRQLPDGVKVKLVKLLEAHPHFKLYLDANRPADVSRNEWIIMRAATWPDFVRPDRRNPRPEIEKYHKGAWHYIDVPFVPKGEKDLDP